MAMNQHRLWEKQVGKVDGGEGGQNPMRKKDGESREPEIHKMIPKSAKIGVNQMQVQARRVLFSQEEVARHSSENDCWLIMSDEQSGNPYPYAGVYDVTRFLPDHPGGKHLLLQMAAGGRDCRGSFEDVEHSDYARLILGDYRIGDILLSSQEEEGIVVAPVIQDEAPDNGKSKMQHDDPPKGEESLEQEDIEQRYTQQQPANNAPVDLDSYDQIADYCIVGLLAADLATTILVLWTIRQPLECCNQDIYEIYDDREFLSGVAVVFILLLLYEAYCFYKKQTSLILMSINPILAFFLTYGLIASTNYIEAILTIGLEIISLLLEIYAVWSLRYRAGHEQVAAGLDRRCFRQDHRKRNKSIQIIQGISILLICTSVFILVRSVYYGGVCLRDEDGSSYALATRGGRGSCSICPSTGLPVTDTSDDDLPRCPGAGEVPVELTEFCGLDDGDGVVRFCFFPFGVW